MSARSLADVLDNPAGFLVIEATVVLAMACVVAGLAKKLSAARRHLLFVVALSSCAWLVLSSPVVPAIVIHAPILARNAGATRARTTDIAPAHANIATAAQMLRVPRQSANAQIARGVLWRPIRRPSHPLIVLWIVGCLAMVCRDAIGFGVVARFITTDGSRKTARFRGWTSTHLAWAGARARRDSCR